MRVFNMVMLAFGVSTEEDEAELLQSQLRVAKITTGSNCVKSLYGSCNSPGNWNGGKCCFPDSYACVSENVDATSCSEPDIWTGWSCCHDASTDEAPYYFRVGAGTTQSDGCHNLEGVSLQVDESLLEDCTLKDFFVWKKKSNAAPTFGAREYGEDDVWKTVKVQEAEGWQSASCVAYVNTAQGSCHDWCDSHGLQCVMAMDDANHNGTHDDTGPNPLPDWMQAGGAAGTTSCTLNHPADARKRANDLTGYVDSRGCNHKLNSQICACGPSSTIVTNIVELVQSLPELATLVAAVVSGDLVDLMDMLSSPGPFTLFAPTNAAFAALPQGRLDSLLKPENKDELVDILTYHVLPSQVLSTDLAGFQLVTTVQGNDLWLNKDSQGYITVGPGYYDYHNVIVADNMASNGVVHSINGVMSPTARF